MEMILDDGGAMSSQGASPEGGWRSESERAWGQSCGHRREDAGPEGGRRGPSLGAWQPLQPGEAGRRLPEAGAPQKEPGLLTP